MNILITGAGGFVGSHLVQRLKSDSNLNITCLYRSANKNHSQKNSIYLDITKNTCWPTHLEGVDVVIHLAALIDMKKNDEDTITESNYLATRTLVASCASSKVKKVIFLSSAGVYGKSYSELISEEKANFSPTNPYAKSKLLAEASILEISKDSDLKFIILRPALIYGEGNVNSLSILRNIISKNIPLPFRNIKNKRSFLHINNLVAVIEECLKADHINNEIFNVADDEAISTSELINRLSPSSRPNYLNFYIPKFFMEAMLKLLNKKPLYEQLYESLHLDNSKIKKLLSINSLKSDFSTLMNHKFGRNTND